eukprot:XP_020397504.1 uncharacterized protein LOC109941330 [Zea mays]
MVDGEDGVAAAMRTCPGDALVAAMAQAEPGAAAGAPRGPPGRREGERGRSRRSKEWRWRREAAATGDRVGEKSRCGGSTGVERGGDATGGTACGTVVAAAEEERGEAGGSTERGDGGALAEEDVEREAREVPDGG